MTTRDILDDLYFMQCADAQDHDYSCHPRCHCAMHKRCIEEIKRLRALAHHGAPTPQATISSAAQTPHTKPASDAARGEGA